MRIGRLGRVWLAMARPFHRSIHVRFLYAFGLATFGLVLMAAITIVAGGALLNTYENSVAEARFELMPAHDLQVSLREAEHLAYLHAIEGGRSASAKFKALAETVDGLFVKLSDVDRKFGSVEHAHSNVSVPQTIKAWQAARIAALRAFEQEPGTKESADALRRAHKAIDPVYDAISKFHKGSMQDLEARLHHAFSLVKWTFLAIFGAILIGLCVLVALGVAVGRSVLQPISELQIAAVKLGNNDFSHRVRLRNNKDELGQLGRAFNITSAALQRLYGELERRSTYDGLTGVLNRAAFDARLAAESKSADRHGRPLSLLMVDIDFFKRVNDTHGHQSGDQVLRMLAGLLNEAVRPDDVVARYGGEEFAIIFPETGEINAMAMAERIRRSVESHSFLCPDGEEIGITVSIGCANGQAHAAAPDRLVRAADAALYQAKKDGRNRVAASKSAHRQAA